MFPKSQAVTQCIQFNDVGVGYHCALVLRLAFGKSHPITWTLQMVISVCFPEPATKKTKPRSSYTDLSDQIHTRPRSLTCRKVSNLRDLAQDAPESRSQAAKQFTHSIIFYPLLAQATPTRALWEEYNCCEWVAHLFPETAHALGVNLQHSYHFTSSSNNRSDIPVKLKTKG